jgi:hypothetical protein
MGGPYSFNEVFGIADPKRRNNWQDAISNKPILKIHS